MRFAPEESPSLQFLSLTLLLLHLPSILGLSNATTVPDWSDVSLDGHTRYLSVLVIYDVSSYNLKPKLLKAEVLELFLGINEYLYQLDIRVSIADFVPLRRKSRPPLDMEAFRNYYIDMKPSYRNHDVALLLQSSFHTITFAQQMCSNDSSLVLAQFSLDADGYGPQAAEIVQSIFSLVGIGGFSPCKCSAKALAASGNRCLTIRDMDDCIVQRVADRLPEYPCLLEKNYRNHGSLSLCGNGLVESGEHCDSGIGLSPEHLICSHKCAVRPVAIGVIAAVGSAFAAVSIYFVAARIYARRRRPKLGSNTFVTYLAPEYDHEFCTDPKCARPSCAPSSPPTALEAATRLSTAPGQVYLPTDRRRSAKSAEKFVKRKRKSEERLSRGDSIVTFPHSSLESAKSVNRLRFGE
uniref:VWFA domain-containing protein n=1 Tax=Steinernema glaseri TaxID=37863 RepID=A0A1I7ZSS4_9BILA